MQPNEQSKPKKIPPVRWDGWALFSPCYARAAAYHASRRDLGAGKKGPSPTITEKFCRSMRETSAIRWIPNIFLSQEEVDAFKASTENDETETVNTSLIRIAPAAESGTETADDGVSSSPSRAARPRASCSSCAILRASFSAFRVRNSMRRPPACSSRSLWPSMAALPERTRAASMTKNGRGNGGVPQARDLRRSAAPHRARGRAVQRHRL